MTDKTEVYEDAAGGWRWRRLAPNGEIIAVGESYTRESDARRAAARAFMAVAPPEVEGDDGG